tara:strand:- start:5885 stop:6349 length:465 start_codon:yes stop_codon:yes gene_type:complete
MNRNSFFYLLSFIVFTKTIKIDNIIVNNDIMDLFDINDNFTSSFDQLKESEQHILIWTLKVRRTINTYMTGWDIDINTLKGYHSQLKKRFACNGSLKKNKVFGRVYDKSGEVEKQSGKNVKEMVFHLSKNCVDELVEFLKEHDIEESNIEIKGI